MGKACVQWRVFANMWKLTVHANREWYMYPGTRVTTPCYPAFLLQLPVMLKGQESLTRNNSTPASQSGLLIFVTM